MKALSGIFSFLSMLGYFGNGLLFLYTEWLAIKQNFLNLINPLVLIQVVFTLLVSPLFWGLLLWTAIFHFASVGVAKYESD